MSTAKEVLLAVAGEGAFEGRTARREAIRATLAEAAELVGELPLSRSDISRGLTVIAGAYVGEVAGATDAEAPALLGRVRTVRQMRYPVDGYGGWDDVISRLERCCSAWTAIAEGFAAKDDGRARAIAATWRREASYLRAAVEIEDA